MRILPGLILIILAILLLLANFGVYSVNWDLIWRLWPILLILIGMYILLSNRRTLWMGVGVAVVLLVVLLAIGQRTDWKYFSATTSAPAAVSRSFTEGYENTTARSRFELKAGAGSYTLTGTTDDLIKVDSTSSHGQFDLKRTTRNGITTVTLDQQVAGPFNFSRVENNANIRLNSNPIWEISLDTGAASVNADLGDYKVDTLDIDAGAASILVILGDKQDVSRISISTGAASVTLRIPQSVGAEIKADTGLSNRQFDGFTQNGSTYRTEDFDAQAKKMYIDIDSGLSDLKVERY